MMRLSPPVLHWLQASVVTFVVVTLLQGLVWNGISSYSAAKEHTTLPAKIRTESITPLAPTSGSVLRSNASHTTAEIHIAPEMLKSPPARGNLLVIMSIFGTRPEAVKLLPVIMELQQHQKRILHIICITGQHKELVDSVLAHFSIEPDFDLNIMEPQQTLAGVTHRTVAGLQQVLEFLQEKNLLPNGIVVQGDTTAAMAAGLVAVYWKIPVLHIEAGWRTYDLYAPFPEELNRRVIAIFAKRHYSPTYLATRNLIQEGVPRDNIVQTGNPAIDAVRILAEQLPSMAALTQLQKLDIDVTVRRSFSENNSTAPKLVLVTVHRRENWGAPLQRICQAVIRLARAYSGRIRIVFAMHPNPKVKDAVVQAFADARLPDSDVILSDAIDYEVLTHIYKRLHMILTDSGGIQAEATAFAIPTLVMRTSTELMEAVMAGATKLIGTEENTIFSIASDLLENKNAEWDQMHFSAKEGAIFGDGHAAEKIVADILRYKHLLLPEADSKYPFTSFKIKPSLKNAKVPEYSAPTPPETVVFQTLEDVQRAIAQPRNDTPAVLVSMISYAYVTQTNGRLPLLLECLASVRMQNFSSYEHVLIDDGSPVDLSNALAHLNDPNLRVYRKPNSGILTNTLTYNLALRMARGKYHMLLPSDDISVPSTMERLSNIMEKQAPDVIAVHGVALFTTGWIPGIMMEPAQVYYDNAAEKLAVSNWVHGCAIMWRKSALDQIELPPNIVGEAADYDTWTRLSEVGKFIGHNELVVIYRNHADTTRHIIPQAADPIIKNKLHEQYIRSSARKRRAITARDGLINTTHLLPSMLQSRTNGTAARILVIKNNSSRTLVRIVSLLTELVSRCYTSPRLANATSSLPLITETSESEFLNMSGDLSLVKQRAGLVNCAAETRDQLLSCFDWVWVTGSSAANSVASAAAPQVQVLLLLEKADVLDGWPLYINLGNLDYVLFPSLETLHSSLPVLRLSGYATPAAVAIEVSSLTKSRITLMSSSDRELQFFTCPSN